MTLAWSLAPGTPPGAENGKASGGRRSAAPDARKGSIDASVEEAKASGADEKARWDGRIGDAVFRRPGEHGGLLTRMRGGIQNVAGTGAKKRESPISKIVTLLLVLLAAYFVAKRFGLVP